jgi:hypothetical protein
MWERRPQFDLTSALPGPLFSSAPGPLPQRDIIQDIQNGASSLLEVAATRASDAASHVQSSISSAVASLPEAPEIEDYFPLNCSFGIRQFCVGYRHEQSLSCSDSPFKISTLLPDEIESLPSLVEDALRERIGELYPLAHDLNSLPTSILICLIIGSITMILALGVSSCLAFDNRISRKAGPKARIVIYFFMAVACCVPYLALALIQNKVMRKAKGLPNWVAVEQGDIFGYSIGLFVCAAIFVPLSAAASYQKVVQWIKDRVYASNHVH